MPSKGKAKRYEGKKPNCTPFFAFMKEKYGMLHILSFKEFGDDYGIMRQAANLSKNQKVDFSIKTCPSMHLVSCSLLYKIIPQRIFFIAMERLTDFL